MKEEMAQVNPPKETSMIKKMNGQSFTPLFKSNDTLLIPIQDFQFFHCKFLKSRT